MNVITFQIMTNQENITERTIWGGENGLSSITEEEVHVWEHDAPEYVKLFGSKMGPWGSRE